MRAALQQNGNRTKGKTMATVQHIEAAERLRDALARHPLGGTADDDYIWEALMGDASPDAFVRDGENLEAAAAQYADWYSQEYPEYETTEHDTGDTVTRPVTAQDVCDLTAWIANYVGKYTEGTGA